VRGGNPTWNTNLGRATGKRFDVLAATLLFDPLGVSDVAWTWLPHGNPKNWCCLWMRPRDMAKIGIDRINDRYGRCAIGFGLLPPEVRTFKGHAAFHRVPESWEF
jgi:hypothetical protein